VPQRQKAQKVVQLTSRDSMVPRNLVQLDHPVRVDQGGLMQLADDLLRLLGEMRFLGFDSVQIGEILMQLESMMRRLRKKKRQRSDDLVQRSEMLRQESVKMH